MAAGFDRFLTKMRGNNPQPETAEETAEDRQKRRTIGHARQMHLAGMGRLKFPTTGQQRRQQTRSRDTQRRKATSRHHRQWLRAQQAVATLRGQLQVIDNRDNFNEDLYWNTRAAVEATYGSIQEARKQYREVTNG